MSGEAIPCTFTQTLGYRPNGTIEKATIPAVAGLPAETVTTLSVPAVNIPHGDMTGLQKALEFPKGMLDSHTEAKAETNTALQGTLAPCTACKGYMNRAAEFRGVDVVYAWENRTWMITK